MYQQFQLLESRTSRDAATLRAVMDDGQTRQVRFLEGMFPYADFACEGFAVEDRDATLIVVMCDQLCDQVQ